MNKIFDGNGFWSNFFRLEIHKKRDMNYYCFWVPLHINNAKRLGYDKNENFDPRLDEEGFGKLIITFPEFVKGNRNVHQLRSQPDSKVFLIEHSWEGKETPFSRRREDMRELIKEKIKKIEKLTIIKTSRQHEFVKTIRDKTKEIYSLKQLSGEYPIDENF